jgi:hypothetical protein
MNNILPPFHQSEKTIPRVPSLDTTLLLLQNDSCTMVVSRYKVLWIGKIAKHKGIGETKVLRRKKKAKVLWIYWLPKFDLLAVLFPSSWQIQGIPRLPRVVSLLNLQ